MAKLRFKSSKVAYEERYPWKSLFIYGLVLFSLLGANILSPTLGGFEVSLFRITVAALTLIMVIEVIASRSITLFKYKDNRYSLIFMLIWAVYAALSVLWVKDYGAWLKAVYFVGLGFLLAAIFSRILKQKEQILSAFRIMAIMAAVHNILGWYEIITHNYTFISGEKLDIYIAKLLPVSTFDNTNNFGTFMMFAIFILIMCYTVSENTYAKAFYLITAVSSGTLVVIAESRANIIGLAMALLLFIVLNRKKIRPKHVLYAIAIVAVSVLAIYLTKPILLGITPKGGGGGIGDNNIIYFVPDQEGSSDSSRIGLIRNGLLFVKDTFGVGTGAGNIEYWMKNYGTYNANGMVNMHNWWIEILTAYGVIIFILYMLFYLKLFFDMYRRFKENRSPKDSAIALSIMCCMVGFILGSISSSSNISVEWLWVFWALCIAYQGLERRGIFHHY